ILRTYNYLCKTFFNSRGNYPKLCTTTVHAGRSEVFVRPDPGPFYSECTRKVRSRRLCFFIGRIGAKHEHKPRLSLALTERVAQAGIIWQPIQHADYRLFALTRHQLQRPARPLSQVVQRNKSLCPHRLESWLWLWLWLWLFWNLNRFRPRFKLYFRLGFNRIFRNPVNKNRLRRLRTDFCIRSLAFRRLRPYGDAFPDWLGRPGRFRLHQDSFVILLRYQPPGCSKQNNREGRPAQAVK